MTDMGNYVAAAAMAADTVNILPASAESGAEIRKTGYTGNIFYLPAFLQEALEAASAPL